MKLKQIETLCRAWPGVTQDRKWKVDEVFSVGDKMFAVVCDGGPQTGYISFKVEDELFLPLTEQPGIVPAPYVARYKWVMVTEPQRYPKAWFHERLRRSYELVRDRLPRRLRLSLQSAN